MERITWQLTKRRGKPVIRLQVGGRSKAIERAEKKLEARERQIRKRYGSYTECKCCHRLVLSSTLPELHLSRTDHGCQSCVRVLTDCPYSDAVKELLRAHE